MSLQLLPATSKDAPLLTVIAIASKGYWGYSEQEMIAWIPDLMIFEDTIENHIVYKLANNNEIVGFYILNNQDNDIADLEFLFLLPEFIGQGNGAQLLQHAIEKAKENGTKYIRVLSDPNTEEFYGNFGFKNIGKKESIIPERFLPIMILEV